MYVCSFNHDRIFSCALNIAIATHTILQFQVVQTIRLVVSEISQDELTANTGANTSIATSDSPDLPPIESQENTSQTLPTATVSGEKQLLLLEESIGWLERALSDLGEFTQLGQTKSDVVKGLQDLPRRGTGSLLCC